MDIVQDWGQYLLTTYLTSSSNVYLSILYRTVSTVRSFLQPLLVRLSTNPDLASLALLVILLFISLKILDMLYRAVMFWVRLAIRVAFWGTIACVLFYVYTRGVNGAADDAQYWASHFGKEYEIWKEQARVAQIQRKFDQQMGRGAGGGQWRTGR